MTATEPATPVCPHCGSTETMILSDGAGRCFECQTEWDPKNLAGIPRRPEPVASDLPSAATPATGSRAEDVSGPVTEDLETTPTGAEEPAPAPNVDLPPSREQVEFERIAAEADAETAALEAELVGASVVLEGGQMATIRSFPDLDHAVVQLSDLSEVTVPLGDIERSIMERGAHAPDPEPADDAGITVTPEDAYMLSGLIIRMGIASIVEGPDGDEVGRPPAGWMPYSPEANALVEAGAAVAVARLIIAYDIPVQDLLEGLDSERPIVDTGDPTGGTQ